MSRHPWNGRSPAWPSTPAGSRTRPTPIRAVEHFLTQEVDPDRGAARSWITTSVAAATGYGEWAISIAVSTLIGERRARIEFVNGTEVVFPLRGRAG